MYKKSLEKGFFANYILFTDKSEQIYRTGLLEDPSLTDRLYAADAKFSGEIVEEASPIVSFIFSWIFPILIFWALGQWLTKK